MASARFSEEMSQPGGHGVTQELGAPPAPPWGPPRVPPTIEDDVVGVHHGQQVPEGHVDVTGGAGAQAHGGGLEQGAVVVGFLGWESEDEEGSQHPQSEGLGLQSPSARAGRGLGCRAGARLSSVSPSLWDDPRSQNLTWGPFGDTHLDGVTLGTPQGQGPCSGHSGDTHPTEVTLGTPSSLGSL